MGATKHYMANVRKLYSMPKPLIKLFKHHLFIKILSRKMNMWRREREIERVSELERGGREREKSRKRMAEEESNVISFTFRSEKSKENCYLRMRVSSYLVSTQQKRELQSRRSSDDRHPWSVCLLFDDFSFGMDEMNLVKLTLTNSMTSSPHSMLGCRFAAQMKIYYPGTRRDV